MSVHYNYAYTLLTFREQFTSFGTFFSLKAAKGYASKRNLGHAWINSGDNCWKGYMLDPDIETPSVYIVRSLINIHLGAAFCGVNVEE